MQQVTVQKIFQKPVFSWSKCKVHLSHLLPPLHYRPSFHAFSHPGKAPETPATEFIREGNTKSVLNTFKDGRKFWFSAPLPGNIQSLNFYTTETNSDQHAMYSISGNLGIVCLLCPWIMKSMLLSKCHHLRSNTRGIFQGFSTTIFWLSYLSIC